MSTSPIPRRVVGSSIHLPVHYCHLLHNQLRSKAIPHAHSINTLRSAQHHYYQHATSGHSHRAVHVHHRLHVASPPSLRTRIRALFCPPSCWTGPPESIRQISPVLCHLGHLVGRNQHNHCPLLARATRSSKLFWPWIHTQCSEPLYLERPLKTGRACQQYAQFGLRLLHNTINTIPDTDILSHLPCWANPGGHPQNKDAILPIATC
jgi:hypothetical protein